LSSATDDGIVVVALGKARCAMKSVVKKVAKRDPVIEKGMTLDVRGDELVARLKARRRLPAGGSDLHMLEIMPDRVHWL
jgi:hypothetical protein